MIIRSLEGCGHGVQGDLLPTWKICALSRESHFSWGCSSKNMNNNKNLFSLFFFFTYMNIWPLGLLHVSRRNSCDRNGWGLWEVLLLNTNKMEWSFFNWHQPDKKLSSPKVDGFLKRQGKRWQLCSKSLAALHWYFSSEFEKALN